MARGLLLLAVALLFQGLSTPAGAQVPPPPNVVLIVTDDVGYGDFSSYGAPDIRTPHIDSIARDGTKFTDFYAAPQCTPTRTALITGRYQQRYELERALPSTRNAGARGLPATGQSLPQLLRNNGYTTALVGKWHLGYKPEHSPNAHGFDHFFGFKSGYIDYYEHTDSDGAPDLYENETPVRIDGYMTDLITARAVDFVRRNASRRFFLEVTYNAAHWPFQVPDHPSVARNHSQFLQPADDNTSTRADYVQMVERADAGVGQILAALDAAGLARNTLVIFTNDNGGEWLSRNAPLYHRKDTLWEGGIRVPLMMRWPGRIPEGRISSQVGIFMDLTATILAATRSASPTGARLEGIDLLPIVAAQAPTTERTLFFRIATASRQQRAVRRGEWKLLVDGSHLMVFNLLRDIGERDDVAREHPEVARALLPLLKEWERDVDSEAQSRASR
jgi:arylsulfatase A-like enzyme